MAFQYFQDEVNPSKMARFFCQRDMVGGNSLEIRSANFLEEIGDTYTIGDMPMIYEKLSVVNIMMSYCQDMTSDLILRIDFGSEVQLNL